MLALHGEAPGVAHFDGSHGVFTGFNGWHTQRNYSENTTVVQLPLCYDNAVLCKRRKNFAVVDSAQCSLWSWSMHGETMAFAAEVKSCHVALACMANTDWQRLDMEDSQLHVHTCLMQLLQLQHRHLRAVPDNLLLKQHSRLRSHGSHMLQSILQCTSRHQHSYATNGTCIQA